MLQRFKEHIAQNFPKLKDQKILLAISGGLDSMVLFDLLKKINSNFSLAHCNFKLRGIESDLDEEFIVNESQKSSNQLFKTFFDTNNYALKQQVSTQIAARELRYKWFNTLIETHRFDCLLTAHHADDNLETFLINLTRGTGLEGFTGIPEKNGNIIRPLLPFSRIEILAYAEKNHLKWREDASNASHKYIRNKIRHQVIPVLKEINPSLLQSFSNTSAHLKESQQIIEDKIDEISTKIIEKDVLNGIEIRKINIVKLQELSHPKAYLYQLLKDYKFTAWNDVYNLLSAQSGKQVFSDSYRLVKDRDFLLLTLQNEKVLQQESVEINENESKITNPISISFQEALEKEPISKQTICIDKDLLKYPLKVRKWENGDYFYPTAMQGKKKVSKFFKDEKFSLLEKEQTWLLCSAENQVIWIINHRQDRRFAINEHTKKRLKISTLS